jgi:hypothetical protein
MANVDLKNHTAWSHIQGTERAAKRVSSWPAWKRNATLFRDSSENELHDEVKAKDEAIEILGEGLRKIA